MNDQPTNAIAISKEAFNRPQNLQVLKQMGQSIKQALTDAMPDFLKKEAPSLLQAMYTECQMNPQLMNCTPMSLFAAVIQAGRCGLKIGGALGQGYLIPFKGRATFVPGYKGLIQLVNRSGQVGIINAKTVYDADTFEVVYGTSSGIIHKPGKYPDAAAVHARKAVAYYAACKTQQGDVFEVMTKAEAEVHRDRFALAKNGPWKDHFDAMAMKTCVRRLCKWLPMSDTVMSAVAIDEALEETGEPLDASFLFADALPEGEVVESKVDQLRDRVAAATSPPDKLIELHAQLVALGGLSDFLGKHNALEEDLLTSKNKTRSEWCTKLHEEIKRLTEKKS